MSLLFYSCGKNVQLFIICLFAIPISIILLIVAVIVRSYAIGRRSKGPAPPPSDSSRKRLSEIAAARKENEEFL
ncbi:MAG: hypothetical protein FK732_03020 [Asgard group archaeon]|nr:hypothetical protein [Asgard group archaeon]